MTTNPPSTLCEDDVYVEVFYLTTDVEHDRYDKAHEIRKYAQCGDIDCRTWDLYRLICEGVLSLENMPGECSIGVLLSHIYSKLQRKGCDERLCFCDSTCDIPRKATIGDVLGINGLAYFIDVASTFTYVGEIETLSDPQSSRPEISHLESE